MAAAVLSQADTPEGLEFRHGRGWNTMSDVYPLPSDDIEMAKLRQQQKMWTLLMGGLYPQQIDATVRELLTSKDGPQPAVLDIGTGPGIWAIEMAQEFPNAKVIGIDLIDIKPTTLPPNCSLVKGDVTKGIPQFAEAFDVIHCRSVAGHVLDPVALVRTARSCLKPGGIFIFADGSFIYNEQKVIFKPAEDDGVVPEDRSWVARYMLEVKARVPVKDTKNTPGEHLIRWIQEDGGFEKIDGDFYFCPICWDGDGVKHGKELGEIMGHLMFDFVTATKSILLTNGISNDVVESWVKRIHEELDEPKVRMYLKWNMAWARKPI